MMISHKDKWIFIHIPKTGGTTIGDELRPYCDVEGVESYQLKDKTIKLKGKRTREFFQHDVLADIKVKLSDKGIDCSDYYTFSFVRNPWALVVSRWAYWNMLARKDDPWASQVVANCNTFTQFVNSDTYCPKKNQLNFLTDSQTSELAVDFVGRLENIQSDFDIICEVIGIQKRSVGHNNKSNHKHYTEYYNDNTINVVATTFAKDIEYFNYKFGD